MRRGPTDSTLDGEAAPPTGPERADRVTAKGSRFALIILGVIAVAAVVSIVLNILGRIGLISSLTRDALELLTVCAVVIPMCFFLGILADSAALRLCLWIFAGLAVLDRTLDFTDAIASLDGVPIIGRHGLLHATFRYVTVWGTFLSVFATLYFLLSSLEKSYAQLKIDARKLKKEVADRSRAEVSLREAEAKYRQMFEANSDGLMIADVHGVVVDANTAACRMHRYNRGEFIGRRPVDVIHPDHYERFCEFSSKVQAGKDFQVELINSRSDGSPVYVEVHGTPITYQGRLHSLCVLRDISQRRQVEQALRDSEQKFRGIFESEPECVMLLDSDGILIDMNPAGVAMVEADSIDQVRGECIYEIIAPEYREDAMARNKAVFRGEPQQAEFEILGLKGTRRWMETHEVPLTNADGQVTMMLAVTRDVTKRRQADDELRRSESQLSRAQQIAQLGNWEWEIETGKVRWSEQTYRLFGYRPGEIDPTEALALSIVHLDDRPRIQQARREALLGEKPYNLECRVVTHDDVTRVMHSQAEVVRDEIGEPVRMIGTVQDITERHRVESDLRDRARQQAAVAELGQRALTDIDLADLIDEAVSTLSRVLDADFSKMMELLPDGKTLLFRAGVGWPADFKNQKTLTAESDSQAGVTLRSREPVVVDDLTNDDRFPLTPTLKEHGVTSGMTVVIAGRHQPFGVLGAHTRKQRAFAEHDVDFLRAIANVLAEANQRKQAETAIRESEEQYRTLMENHVDGVSIVAGGKVVLVNKQMCELTGYTIEEMLGRSPADFVAVEDRPRSAQRIAAILDGAKEFVSEYAIQGKHGRKIPIDVASKRIHYQGELAMLSVVRDISERKRALELARQRQEELVHVSRLNTMGEMASGLAHELNQPLTAISVFAETCLIKSNGAADQAGLKPILEKIRDQSIRAGGIITRLRQFVDKGSFQQDAVRVDRIIDDVLALLDWELKKESIEVDVQLDDRLPPIHADAIQLEQVVLNLVRNAAEAIIQDDSVQRRVFIQATQNEANDVEISVRDTGPGVDEEALDRVFDAFFTTKDEGMGMGLAICRSIVEAHGGKLSALPGSERGVTFRMTLPRERDEVIQEVSEDVSHAS